MTMLVQIHLGLTLALLALLLLVDVAQTVARRVRRGAGSGAELVVRPVEAGAGAQCADQH